jgi:hypothetical protein
LVLGGQHRSRRSGQFCSARRRTLGVAAGTGNVAPDVKVGVKPVTEPSSTAQRSDGPRKTANLTVDASLFRNYFTRHPLPGVSLAAS